MPGHFSWHVNGVRRPEKWFRKNVQMDVCACMLSCMRAYMHFEKFKRLYLRNYSTDRIEIWYGGKASVSFFSIISITIDLRIDILRRFQFFEIYVVRRARCLPHNILNTRSQQLKNVGILSEYCCAVRSVSDVRSMSDMCQAFSGR